MLKIFFNKISGLFTSADNLPFQTIMYVLKCENRPVGLQGETFHILTKIKSDFG